MELIQEKLRIPVKHTDSPTRFSRTVLCNSPEPANRNLHLETLILIQDPDFTRKLSPREEVPSAPPPSTHPAFGKRRLLFRALLKVWGQCVAATHGRWSCTWVRTFRQMVWQYMSKY